MAEPIVRLDPVELSVEPGGQAVTTVTVVNPGNVVEGYDVDIVSTTPMPWASASPTPLSVYPQQEASAVVSFDPPRGPETPGGTFPFGVRVRSQIDPTRSTVAEGDLTITAVSGLHASLTPVTSSGRWRGAHTLRLENFGNLPVLVRVVASDPDQELGFLVSPPLLDLPVAGSALAQIKVRTRHPFLRGTAKRLPFSVVCESDAPRAGIGSTAAVSTPDRPVVDGAFNQRPILDRWVVLAGALLLLVLVGVLVWALEGGPQEPSEDEGTPAAPNQPTGVAVTPEEGVMAISWDRVEQATSYVVRMTRPASGESPTPGQPVSGDPTRLAFRTEIDRVAEYCYRVVAVREGAAGPSVESEEVCGTSVLPPDESGSPTPTTPPTMDPVESGSPSGPTTDPPTTDPTTDDTATPGTPAFLNALSYYSVGSTQDDEDLAAAQEGGLDQVKLGRIDDLELDLSSGLEMVLYVEGVSEAEAEAACRDVQAVLPAIVDNACGSDATHPLPPAASTPAPVSGTQSATP